MSIVLCGLLLVAATVLPGQASATAGPDTTPDLSTTIILPDGRSIALRQWFSSTGAGTDSATDRNFTWTAPSTTSLVDVLAFGGGGGGGGGRAGNHGNPTSPNVRGAGGGGGGGGEVRRDSAISVTPGETLSAQAGAGGVGGLGATRDYTNADSGGDGSASFLKRADTTVLLLAAGGTGGTGGSNTGGSTASTPGSGGAGGTGGSGGTLLTTGIDGVGGSNSTTAPAAAAGLDNSGSDWLYHGLRLGGGGGGGGGKSSNGGSTNTISPGTDATTASVYDLTDLSLTIARIGGDGDGGNNTYVSEFTKNAPTRLGGGGGGGAYVFSSGRQAGRGGSGEIIMTYVVADLLISELVPADPSIPVTTGSTTITLQLRDAAGTATNVSVGPIEMSISGTDATIGSVTDNGDGTYSVTITAGSELGTATVSASVVGSDFAQTAEVVIEDPNATVPPGRPGPAIVTPLPGALEVTVVPPTTGGIPESYLVTLEPGGLTCTVTGASGSCTIDGLESGQAYTVTVVASNAGGDSPPSEVSGPFSPLTQESTTSDLPATGSELLLIADIGLAILGIGAFAKAFTLRRRRIDEARLH